MRKHGDDADNEKKRQIKKRVLDVLYSSDNREMLEYAAALYAGKDPDNLTHAEISAVPGLTSLLWCEGVSLEKILDETRIFITSSLRFCSDPLPHLAQVFPQLGWRSVENFAWDENSLVSHNINYVFFTCTHSAGSDAIMAGRRGLATRIALVKREFENEVSSGGNLTFREIAMFLEANGFRIIWY